MKLLKHLTLIAFLCAAVLGAHAQRTLRMDFITTFPASIDSGQNAQSFVKVINADTGTYTGRLTYAYTINGIAGSDNPTSGLDYDTTAIVVIAPGDSIIDSLTAHVFGPAFYSGPSVVVIWPIPVSGDDIRVYDTLKFDIAITQPTNETGIGEIIEGALYYNNGKIVLRQAGKNELMQVRIWNANGAEMYYTEGEHAQYIQLPELPAGMYIAEAILSNNKRAILKFIKPLH
jgi:hypothetical protein